MVRGPVLVVDDDENLREGIKLLLVSNGIEVLTACDGVEALDALRRRPDVRAILLDLEMPIMGGIGFREAQRAEQSLALIPVIVLSGHPNCAQICEALEPYACLPKGVLPGALLAALDHLL